MTDPHLNQQNLPCTSTLARIPSGYFGRMLLFSLLVHALCSAAIILTHRGRVNVAQVQYLDLEMTQSAEPSPTREAPAEPSESMQEEPAPVAEPPEEAVKPEQQSAVPVQQQPPARQESFQQASLGLGIVNGHFGGMSDGRTLRDDMREYYLSMLAKFNESWGREKSPEAGSSRGAVFVVVITRDGGIADIKLLQGSGNPSYDRQMVQALRTAGPLNPLPQSYEQDHFSAPLRFVAPLNLMAPLSG